MGAPELLMEKKKIFLKIRWKKNVWQCRWGFVEERWPSSEAGGWECGSCCGAVCLLGCMHRQLKWWLCRTGSQRKGRKMGADKYSCYETGMDEWFMGGTCFYFILFQEEGDGWWCEALATDGFVLRSGCAGSCLQKQHLQNNNTVKHFPPLLKFHSLFSGWKSFRYLVFKAVGLNPPSRL